jgi:hypothetical protein
LRVTGYGSGFLDCRMLVMTRMISAAQQFGQLSEAFEA